MSVSTSRDLISGLSHIAGRFERAPSELLRARQLLQRVDRKFLLPARLVECLLSRIVDDYLLVPSPRAYFARYKTIYFDTPDLASYHDERRATEPKQNFRIRQYLEANRAFFEVKTKLLNGQTSKKRLRQSLSNESLTGAAWQLVRDRTQLPVDAISRTMAIDYRRMSLLNQHSPERVTIDMNITFDGVVAGRDLQEVAILEVKQEALVDDTPIMRVLGALEVPCIRASKYCTTTALRDPSLPREHVEHVIRTVRRIQAHGCLRSSKDLRRRPRDGIARAVSQTRTRPHEDPA